MYTNYIYVLGIYEVLACTVCMHVGMYVYMYVYVCTYTNYIYL